MGEQDKPRARSESSAMVGTLASIRVVSLSRPPARSTG